MQKITSFLLICLACGLSISNTLYAQSLAPLIDANSLGYYEDAFRYARLTSVQGSSRIQAIGGAQTAIGGDISNLTGNPAGLGFFGKNNFSIGIGAGNASTQTSYFTQKENKNATMAGSKGLGSLNHVSGVIALKNKKSTTDAPTVWRGGSFAFSVSRTNNFQDQTSFQGTNSRNSKLDSYINQAWNVPESRFQNTTDFNTGNINYLRPVYYAFLLGVPDVPVAGAPYFSYFRDGQERMLGKITQEQATETKGGQNQWNFGFGGNVADKFYFGFSAGMTTLNYRKYTTYKEEIDNNNSILTNFTEFDSLQVKGTGVNFNVGFMVRPINMIRIGVSFNAPTLFSMQETFGTTYESKNTFITQDSPNGFRRASALPGSYTYRLRTPARINGGLSVFVGKYGFITGEVEYIAYNSMKLSDYEDITLFSADNSTINTLYKSVLNLKFGAEFRYQNFYARGGYAYNPNPVREIDFIDRSISHITGGLGLSFEQYSFDFSLVNTRYRSGNSPYSTQLDANGYGKYLSDKGVDVGNSPYSESKHTLWQGVLTFSLKF